VSEPLDSIPKDELTFYGYGVADRAGSVIEYDSLEEAEAFAKRWNAVHPEAGDRVVSLFYREMQS
jgi:hypothetical protein